MCVHIYSSPAHGLDDEEFSAGNLAVHEDARPAPKLRAVVSEYESNAELARAQNLSPGPCGHSLRGQAAAGQNEQYIQQYE